MAFAIGLCAADTRGLEGPPTALAGVPSALAPPEGRDDVVHVARFSLSGEGRTGGSGAGDGERRWLPWLLVGALVLAAVAATSEGGDADDDSDGSPVEPTPIEPPDVATPPPGTVDPPTAPGPGTDAPAPRPNADDPTTGVPIRRDPDDAARQGVFLSVGGSRDRRRSTDRSTGFDEARDSLSLGYDRALASVVDAGLAVTLARADAAFATPGSSRRQESGTALLFADYSPTPTVRLSAYVGAAMSDGESRRVPDGDAFRRRSIRSDVTIRSALAGVAIGGEIGLPAAVRADLRLNADYTRNAFEGYDERGDTSFERSVAGRVRESLAVRAGVELTRAIGTARGVLLPQLGVDWIHESRNDPARVVTTLQRDPSVVDISRGDEPDRGHGSANLGLSFLARNGLQTFVALEHLFAHDYRRSDTVTLGLRLELR